MFVKNLIIVYKKTIEMILTRFSNSYEDQYVINIGFRQEYD